MSKRLLRIGYAALGLGIETIQILRSSIGCFGTLIREVTSGRVEVTWLSDVGTQRGLPKPDTSSSLSQGERLAFSRLSDEESPFGYELPEEELLALLRRANLGEDADMLVAELWVTLEWADDATGGDIVDTREDQDE